MIESIDSLWIFYICLFGMAVAGIDAVYSLLVTSSVYRKDINQRLKRLERGDDRVTAMVDLRRDRGLTMGGAYQIPAIWLNRLILRSGLTLGIFRLTMIAAGLVVVSFAIGFFFLGLMYAALIAIVCGTIVPILVLKYLGRRRRNKFTDQFAEAIDIIARSLRAGHPVPSAIKLAAKELPDPIGTEFGMAEDEMTFGLDLESAMRNMQERVGQEDLPLFVTSVAIQTQSGGNLTEILDNLAEVIRLRAKMRRKIRALSAEGRISAYILSATPIALFAIINTMAPGFYSENWHHPWMAMGLGGAILWMAIGNLWMKKMINFRF